MVSGSIFDVCASFLLPLGEGGRRPDEGERTEKCLEATIKEKDEDAVLTIRTYKLPTPSPRPSPGGRGGKKIGITTLITRTSC